jgi:uncharacterized protein (DUF927 family)
VRVTDRDGTAHDWAMPMGLLAGDGAAYRERLLSLGLELAPGRFGRDCLHEYLTLWRPAARVRCVDRTGWHGAAFVLPDATYGDAAGEEVILQTAGAAPAYRVAGTPRAGARRWPATPSATAGSPWGCRSRSPAPALHLLGEESGGFHLVGGSSTGKTTVLFCGASAWGCRVHSWRATDNAWRRWPSARATRCCRWTR